MDGCIAGGAGSDTFCAALNRDAAGTLHLLATAPDGRPAGISTQNENIAALKTTGVDVNVTYSVDLGDMGMLNFDYASTFLDENSTTPFAGAALVECADLYAGQCGLPGPDYQHRLLATWMTPYDLVVSMTWRHLGETMLDGLDTAAASQREEYLSDYMEEQNYLDVAVVYDWSENIVLRAGANNILGDDAPVTTNLSLIHI